MANTKDTQEKNPFNSLETENANQMTEWEKIRELFKDYDDRLHELRKYGFSFVTALLTVGVFATKAITSAITGSAAEGTANATVAAQASTNGGADPNLFNLGLFIVTLMLILALHFFDKNYRVFQEAALTRAKVIERKLNLELSETISGRYGRDRILHRVLYVYLLLIVGVGVLGGCILYPEWTLIYWLSGCVIFVLGVVIFQNTLSVMFKKDKNIFLKEDWTISPLEFTTTDEFRVTLNNLGISPISVGKNELIWKIINDKGVPVYTEYADIESEFLMIDNHVWIIKPEDFKNGGLKPGIYRLVPRGWKEVPLPISIIVHGLSQKAKRSNP